MGGWVICKYRLEAKTNTTWQGTYNPWHTRYVPEAQNYLVSLILVVGKSGLGWKVGEAGRTTKPVPNDQIIVKP